MPILQSFHLQETFTVNKKEKQYILETQVLINGLDKSVQTLILGYQAENPSVSAVSRQTFPSAFHSHIRLK